MRMLGLATACFILASCENSWISAGDIDADQRAEAGTDADADTDTDADADADPDPDPDEEEDEVDIGGGDAPVNVIPRAWSEPAVDGNLREWPPLRYRLDTNDTDLRFGPDQRPSLEDVMVRFDLRWTSAGLYFAAQWQDDVAQADSPLVWQDDSIELYVDGDNNDDHPDYDENDHQYTVVRDLRFGERGEIVDPTSYGIRYAVTLGEGANFAVELVVPWTLLAGSPVVGRIVGIDVALNDDDDGGEEDTHLIRWLAHEVTALGSPVQDTTLFHDLTLGE